MKSDDLYAAVVARIRDVGLPVKAGVCEVFPHGDVNIRFPMGAGSQLLDPETLKPWSQGRTITRGDEIEAFLDQLDESAVTLDDLRALPKKAKRRAVVVAPAPVRGTASPRVTTSPVTTNAFTKNRLKTIKKTLRGVTGYGRRNAEVFELVGYWRQYLDLDERDIRRRLVRWANKTTHKSRTFEKDPAQFRAEILAQFDGGMVARIDRLPKWGQSATSTRVIPRVRVRPRYLSLLSYRLDVFHLAKKQGLTGKNREWEALRPWMHPEDAVLWRDTPRWLRHRLTKLVALLRYVQERNRVEVLALESNTLHDLCGHQPPPPELALTHGDWQLEKSAYPVVMRAAKRLGIIKFVKSGVEGLHGRVYRFLLHPRAHNEGGGA